MTTSTTATPGQTRSQIPQGPRLADLAGMREARTWGEALARDIELYRNRRIPWTDIDPGCVLHGPPGTGKTTFARALAATCRLPLIATSFAEWQGSSEGHLGTTLAAMKNGFDRAVANAPCIFFIDELDAIPKRGGSGSHTQYWNQVTNALLKEFDRLAEKSGVVVVGACNHPDLLDPALVRSGRLDRMIAVTLPNAQELEDIIRFHLTAQERATFSGYQGTEYRSAAILSVGMSGADVAKTVRNARRTARHQAQQFSLKHYIAAVETEGAAPDRATRRRTAIHEAGHAVAALRLALSQDISATIVRRGNTLGAMHCAQQPHAPTARMMIDRIVTILAGRAAEEAILGEPSTLAGGNDRDSDLAAASRLAADTVLRFGFSEETGLVWRPSSAQDDLLPTPAAKQIRAVLDDAYGRALVLVRTESAFITKVADALIERRALCHADIVALDPTRRPEPVYSWEKEFNRLLGIPPAPSPSPAARPRVRLQTSHSATARPRPIAANTDRLQSARTAKPWHARKD